MRAFPPKLAPSGCKVRQEDEMPPIVFDYAAIAARLLDDKWYNPASKENLELDEQVEELKPVKYVKKLFTPIKKRVGP